MAICAAKYGVDLLPSTYDVSLNRPCQNGPIKHYVGEIRFDMYGEGMRHLMMDGFAGLK